MLTPSSPACFIFSSIASVLAAISWFLASRRPLNCAMASFSCLVNSAKSASIVSFICLRMPTIWPDAGSYVEPVADWRKAETASLSSAERSAELAAMRPTVCKKDPAIPCSIAGMALAMASMLAFISPLSSANSEASFSRAASASALAFCASALSACACFKSASACVLALVAASILEVNSSMVAFPSLIDFTNSSLLFLQ
mmetsp:Transcript_18653/g.41363  ORF Transcript_18653/g.41363 Transcript_18653/m.41363 type:complete len:200 (+) Transcript_18653:1392-1991(+)